MRATCIQLANQIQLSPHQETKIPLDLVVPVTARTGSYLSDVVVIGSAVVASKAADFRPAAETKLEFRVVPGPRPGLLESVPRPLRGALVVLLLALLVYIGSRFLTRFFTLQLRVTRKTLVTALAILTVLTTHSGGQCLTGCSGWASMPGWRFLAVVVVVVVIAVAELQSIAQTAQGRGPATTISGSSPLCAL